MIQTGIESRVKIQDVISSQLPNFILDESPKTADFLKQYYISQEFQSGVVDIAENLDQYLDFDNLTPEKLSGDSTLLVGIGTQEVNTVNVSSTKGFPNQYGLLKINNEILTYTGITTNTFTGLTRGFSGITSYHAELNEEELVFTKSNAGVHTAGSSIQNLSSLFLNEFYKKIKYTFAPGFENLNFDKNLNIGNFLKEIKSFYESKGTDDAIKILFRVLYGVDPKIINLEDLLFKPSSAEYLRRETVIVEVLSGNPIGLVGQTIKKIEKLNDPATQASVSEVEPFTRQGKQYYKLSLFIGYGGASLVEGNFKITPSSKSIESVSVGSSVVTVDSTIGFPSSGKVLSGINTITYTDKTLNQFLDCTGIESAISPSDSVFSDEIYFGYEDGDLTKKVEFRITGILSKFKQKSKNVIVSEGDSITIKNLGDKVLNPTIKNRKEIFANSWIYNTSSFIEIDSFEVSTFRLKQSIDRSIFKVGDKVEFVNQSRPDEIIYPTANSAQPYVNQILGDNLIQINNFSDASEDIIKRIRTNSNLRRKLNKPKSISVDDNAAVPIKYDVTSDVTNVYFDDDSGYAASNSLPSATNSGTPNASFFEDIDFKLNKVTFNGLQDLNISTGKFRIIKVNESDSSSNERNKLKLKTGDKVFYQSSGLTFNSVGVGATAQIVGIETGAYFIEIVDKDNGLVKLYSSKSFIPSGTSLELDFPKDNEGNIINETHTFTLYSQRSNIISPAKSLKKFPLNPSLKDGGVDVTLPGTIGKMINGVEIFNYKTDDKIYFGPISSLNVLSGGSGYDVINPPKIEIEEGVGTGATSIVCVKGKVVDAFIDPQDFDIDTVVSIGITGGNGSGAVIEPIIGKRSREIVFDAIPFTSSNGFGVDSSQKTLTFRTRHNLNSGDRVIYNSNRQVSIGQNVGDFISNNEYFVSVVNDKTVRFYDSQIVAAAAVDETDAIGLAVTTGGIQRLIVGSVNNTITGVNVLSGGEGYENRKLSVQPSNVSTIFNQINFENHNFKDGDKIVYEHDGTTISGLSTTPNQQYIVTKIDDNSFKLSDAGIGGTSSVNFNQKIFTSLESTGIGTQTFRYPDIVATVEYLGVGPFGSQLVNANITPVVKGEISDVYLLEKGLGYGSSILNFENSPIVKIKNGADGATPELKPIINSVTGGISTVSIGNSGNAYYSTPVVEVIDSLGIGNGAKLRVVMNKQDGDLTGSIDHVEVVSAGIGYSESTTSILVTPSGVGGLISANVRSLNVNNNLKYGNSLSRLEEYKGILQNVVCGYDRTIFNDLGFDVSKIIGWAYDGNPIYGPYGYTDPEKKTNEIKLLESGYKLDINSVTDRPVGFDTGFFIEDFVYDNSGDLDEFNGRYEINDDYPNGVYAYHATGEIESGNFVPTFPYFIGNKYRSKFEKDNLSIDQSFDFFNSSLRRNTFPYNVTENNSGNDFITEANSIRSQKIEIETVESGSIQDIQIIEDGTNQKVGDIFNFDNTGTDGDGLIVKVASIKGESISSITSFSLSYNQSVITKEDNDNLRITTPDSHALTNGNLVILSGLSSSLSHVNGSYVIGVSSIVSSVISPISNTGTATTEIYSDIATDVTVGDKIRVGNETLTVLNTYDQPNIITVQRGNASLAHTATTPLYVIPDSFTIKKSVDNFNSNVNQKVFFNPIKSVAFVGAAATGSRSREIEFAFGETRITRTIPAKGIYLENHPFVTNQKLIVTNDGNPIGVSNTSGSTISTMPSTVFAVRKNKNVIGIKATIGGNELFLHSSVGGNAVANKDTYSFESVFVQEKVNVKNNKNMVTLESRFHQLKDNDFIDLNVITNTSTGIGTLSEVIVKRDPLKDSLILDPVSCETSGITTSLPPVGVQTGANVITLENHNFTTGQKVNLISSIIPVGLGNSDYFVNVIDDRTFNLCDSFENATANPPIVVGIISAAQSGIHTFSKINPRIFVEKNNDLVFNTSDPSLSGYKFKVYYDKEFKNEFVSTGSSQGFNTPVGIITAGETGSKFTIGYGKSIPDRLYYNIEKLGVAVTADNTVRNYSEIEYVKNNYNGTFKISNVGIKTFTFDSVDESSRTITDRSNCKELSYSTTSGIVTGAINSVNIVSGGSNYKKLPVFVSVGTTTVNDVNVLVKSNNVGNIKKIRVVNEGFEYPSDPTLQPEALLPKFIELRGSKSISSVEIVNGGANYITPPTLIVVDTETGIPFDDSLLKATLTSPKITPGSSVLSVDVQKSPSGISVGNVAIAATGNTNGVSIQKINSTAGTSTFDVFITTPATGYATDPFKSGDTVFIEGLQKVGVAGSGFNSSDYGYKLLSVTNYDSSGTLDKITIDVSQYTSNTGVAVTDVGGFANIINSNVYPSFRLNLKESGFTIGEKIIINGIERDLTVVESGENFVKLQGLYDLSQGDILVGSLSRNRAKSTNILNNQGQFKVDYSLVKDLGWETNVGKLNEDIQVLPDNDYYQNLSYSIQSPIEWDNLKSPVNNLVHTSGFKNFSDTGISSSSSVFPIRGTAKVTTFLDVLPTFAETVRVDTIYNFDGARDIFTGTGSTDLNLDKTRSKFIQLKTVNLTDFIQANTNNVLNVDDISPRYSNLNSDPNSFLDIIQVQPADGLNRVLTLVKNPDNTQTQIAELIILNNNTGSYLLERSKLSSESDFTKFELKTESGKNFLRFTPSDEFKFNVDYDIKRIETKFNTTLTGIGTSSFGFANITGSVVNVGGTTSSITTPIISTFESDTLFIKTQVTDTVTNEMNYVEHLVGRDATNTYLTESYFDSNQGTFSSNILASFSPSLSGIGNSIISFNVTNTRSNQIRVRSNIIGFNAVTAGIGTYRFLASGQGEGSERTQLVESKFDEEIGISTIATLDKNKFIALKATAHVATATSEALHQVYVTHNGTEIFTSQSEYLSIVNGQGNNNANPPLGIGTFHAKFVGDNFVLEFIPDDTVGTKTVRSLNEVFYSTTDEKTQSGSVNHPNPLVFGALTQSSDLDFYNALNGDRINRRNFELTNNNTPIFAKTFDPSDTSIVNIGSGKTFTIKDHFFRTNEELIYTPQSSFVGVGTTAMVYKIGAGSTAFLPSRVFAIRENDDKFSISITKGGDAVTLVDAGEGNNHQFEMAKSLSKALITIDGLVQHPIAQTDLVHQLVGNISAASTIFRLSGISSINLEDLVKIDDEYIRVTNVGLGTNIVGPIGLATDIVATIPLIQGQRGYVGSSAASHNNSSNVTIFKGSYNIVGKEIHFTEAPRGNNSIDVDESNLPPARSDFEGRVYLRNDYSTNRVYDDISNKFTGITSSFELKSGGLSTTGIGNIGGNGILFINNIFQRPSTDNNSKGNFTTIENAGITTVLFSGITTVADGDLILNDTDVNQNDLPRGGVIVSLGSTGGLGYAPLVPAKVKPQISVGGTITSIVGVAHSGASNSALSASYDNETGEMEIFTTNKHFLRVGYDDEVILSGFTFNPSISLIQPITNDKFSVIGVTSEKSFKVNLGISSISHTVSGGTVRPWYGDLTFGSGYNTGVTTNGVSVAATVFDPGYNHVFVSAETNAISVTGGSNFTPTDATYDPVTGDLVLFISGAGIQTHGLTESNTVQIATRSISFTCSKDNFQTIHPYPRPTDPVAGITTAITSYNSDTITVNVGSNVGSGAQVTTTIGVGGALSFNVVSGGSNYKEPEIFVPSPSYDNMKIEGVSRVGFGTGTDTGTGALISVSGVTTTGISNFELSRNGYNFRKGDKFTPVGLVTDKSFSSAETFVLEVEKVYQDNFSSWQFGEFDFIDSIKSLQNGSRTAFPLLYNGELLSIIVNQDSDVIAQNILLIFINGVLQKPGENYKFDGGTVLSFTTAPSVEDDIAIYVYKGTSGDDTVVSTDINKILEEGDDVQIMRSPEISDSITQDERTAFELTSKDRFETNLYTGQGIDDVNFKPLNVYKQKVDKIINSRIVPKTRDSIEPQIYPTAKVISSIASNSAQIYVDNADFFNYEDEGSPDFEVKLIPNNTLPTVGSLTATISNGQVNAISIASSGSNYTSAPTISISAPPSIGVGVGTTATATVTVGSGGINGFTITNAGFGYTVAPSVLVQPPVTETEVIKVEAVTGFSATITRIRVATSGISTITFNVSRNDGTNFSGLSAGDYIFINNTTYGNGVTSLTQTGNSNVGVGTTFFDNVYQVSAVNNVSGANADVVCKATVTAPDNSLDTGALPNVGTLSFGKLSSLNRSSSPLTVTISGFTVNSGLSTFPSIQRSSGDYTLRKTGALPKTP